MITKAIIEEVIDCYSVRVRIPLYNKLDGVQSATPKDELSIAPICSIPNCKISFNKGDIVFVSFEEDLIEQPVVIGHLLKENMGNTFFEITTSEIEVKNSAVLPSNTTIGEVSSLEIACLQGIKNNISIDIDDLTDKSNSLTIKTEELDKRTTKLEEVEIIISPDTPDIQEDKSILWIQI